MSFDRFATWTEEQWYSNQWKCCRTALIESKKPSDLCLCVRIYIREYERSLWSTGPWSCCWAKAETRTKWTQAVREFPSPPPPPPPRMRYQHWARSRTGANSPWTPGCPRGETTAGTTETCRADAGRPVTQKHKHIIHTRGNFHSHFLPHCLKKRISFINLTLIVSNSSKRTEWCVKIVYL